jgi:hypothetical protein
MFMNVDFPDPEGPIMATYSPSLIVRLMFFNTGKLPAEV